MHFNLSDTSSTSFRTRNKYLSPICQLEEEELSNDSPSVPNPFHPEFKATEDEYKHKIGGGYLGHRRMKTSTPVNPRMRRRSDGAGESSSTKSNMQYFSLRWNNYQSNITAVFYELLETQSFVDVTLACEDRFLKAHRVRMQEKMD